MIQMAKMDIMLMTKQRKLYYIVSMHLYSASCSAYQSEALPVRETPREESSENDYGISIRR